VHRVFQQPWYLLVRSLSAADAAHNLVAQFVGGLKEQEKLSLGDGLVYWREPLQQRLMNFIDRLMLP
jgi:hypothetical protein